MDILINDTLVAILQRCNCLNIIMFSHVSKKWFDITRPFKAVFITTDYLLCAIEHEHTNISMFLLDNNYTISGNAKNAAIRLNQFKVVNKIIATITKLGKSVTTTYSTRLPGMLLDISSIQAAIQSNNVKMVRYITNRMTYNIDVWEVYFTDIAISDNIEIFKHCKGTHLLTGELNVLLNQKSVKIIEYLRWTPKRREFENYCLNYARATNNIDMINYFSDNDYGNH